MPPVKKTTTSAAKKPAAPRKPRAPKAVKPTADTETMPVEASEEIEIFAPAVETAPSNEPAPQVVALAKGKYVYATGRRKTSVANVRMFFGSEKSMVNKKDLAIYFSNNNSFIDQAKKPLQLTGMENQVYILVNANGGGLNSQSQAIAQGIATAIATSQPDFRKVLKKNGMLTRDSRMKERKKPGLKRARRGPQWAKR